jgi:hypothetical protein
MVVTKKYVRKPLYVDAIQVTVDNMVEVAEWCQGEIRDHNDQPLSGVDVGNSSINRYIHVRVHNPKTVRQTKAFTGDWILYTVRGYKVYTQKAFKNSFALVDVPPELAENAEPMPHEDLEEKIPYG